MTPFGARVRELRQARGLSQKEFAGRLGVSPAYISALEHGRRGRPTFVLVQGVIHALGVIWDEADDLLKLAELSDPRVVIDTAGLEPAATLLANRLARTIRDLDRAEIEALAALLERAAARRVARPDPQSG